MEKKLQELCRGGELLHAIAHRPHYSEMTVASFMRAVLRTLAQCHSHRILHRDVKPGNFMLLSEAPDAPLKAIDFGLAAFFDPAKLPRSDLGSGGDALVHGSGSSLLPSGPRGRRVVRRRDGLPAALRAPAL